MRRYVELFDFKVSVEEFKEMVAEVRKKWHEFYKEYYEQCSFEMPFAEFLYDELHDMCYPDC